MKQSMGVLAAGLLAAAPLGVHAQSQDLGLRMDSGFYITAGVGKSRTNLSCTGGVCDATDTSWVASAGYQFNRNFAAEIGYVDLGKSTTTGALVGGGTVTAITDAKAAEIVGVGILPFTDKWSAFLKAGLYRSEAKSTSSGLAGAGIGSGKDTDTGFTFAAGLRYSITPNLGVHFEWQNYNDVGTGVIGFPAADYTVWRAGARYKF